MAQVAKWLDAKLPSAAAAIACEACRAEGIDGQVLLSLNEQELREVLGVARFGDRRKVSTYILLDHELTCDLLFFFK